ncbi:MAG: hypothetical protein P8M63_11465, partial [Paracoccaceae bacterium]|nr:hypothetical protein [Paracoccaceae bacterium]
LVRNLGLIWYETSQRTLKIAIKIWVLRNWWCPGKEIDQETQEIVPVFHRRNDPEEGAIGIVINERILTPRGEQVAQCLGNLHVLREMLLVLGHRFTAERIVNRRFGT